MAGYEAVQAAIAVLSRHYAAALAMPAHAVAYMDAIAPAAWAAFRPGTTFHKPEVFAEVIAFHALKAAGLPVDQATFRKASLVGDMPIAARDWLLHYAAHLPPALRVASREAPPEAWLARMPAHPVVARARDACASGDPRLATMRPRIRAGACVVAAWKATGMPKGERPTLVEILGAAGIPLATAYNAAMRVGLIPPTSKRVRMTTGTAAIA